MPSETKARSTRDRLAIRGCVEENPQGEAGGEDEATAEEGVSIMDREKAALYAGSWLVAIISVWAAAALLQAEHLLDWKFGIAFATVVIVSDLWRRRTRKT